MAKAPGANVEQAVAARQGFVGAREQGGGPVDRVLDKLLREVY